MRAVIAKLKGGIVVSSQACQGEPLDAPEHLAAMAEAALGGGACAVRMAQIRNIRYFRDRHPEVPMIGITKPEIIPPDAFQTVYITPTLADIASLVPYCDIVAMDATMRPRPGGETLAEIVEATRERWPELALMADIATLEEGLFAERLGFDLLGTTLSGYTAESLQTHDQGPDLPLLEALASRSRTPIILEGRIWHPDEVARAFSLGAHAVVIGSALTRPGEIMRRFARKSVS